jgi:signal transduction histidine kinase
VRAVLRNDLNTWRPLARPFVVFFAVAFAALGAIALAALLIHDRSHERNAALTSTLERTLEINRRTRSLLNEQLELLHRLPRASNLGEYERFRILCRELGHEQIRYLKLNIGPDERLLVERINRIQAEIGLHAARGWERVLAGDALGARREMDLAEARAAEAERATDRLSGMQLTAVHESLERGLDARQHALTWGGLMAGFLFTLGGFVLLLRTRVLKPLGALAATAHRIGAGEYGARAELTRRDEIGRLAETLNGMAAALEGEHERLERKVLERTRELRELQGSLVQFEKMSAVGRLVSGVAHELNNPLTAIVGYAELAEAGLARSAAGAPERGHLAVVREQAERCRKIVADLLQFVRRNDTRLDPVKLNEAVQGAVQLGAYELTNPAVRLERSLSTADPIVLADASKIQQAVLALISNAADAILERAREGTIRIETRVEEDRAVIDVRDEGTGIREIDRIFDPFYTTKGVGKGTGLGLSICFGIVKEHGGEISAENWERGARFTIRLPLAPAAIATAPATRDAGAPACVPNGRALVVDDEELIVEIQLAMLTGLGVTAVGAASGEAALEYLSRHSVDLVVSDIRMPGRVDGLALFDWVRANRPALCPRFLFTTGDPTRVGEGLPAEAAGCIVKPFTREQYYAAVSQAFSDSRVAP